MNDKESAKLLKEGLARLRSLKERLIRQGKQEAASALTSQILRIEAVAEVHLRDLAGLKLPRHADDPRAAGFRQMWAARYPGYGKPSAEDNRAITRLLAEVDPAPADLEKALANFARSDDDWVVNYREIRIFCRHYRTFARAAVLKPIKQPQARPAESFGARGISDLFGE